MTQDAVIVICSRPESSRLPRKVFKKIAGLPVIEHILHRIKDTKIKTILAVPWNCPDYDYLKDAFEIDIFHGSPSSPLHRMAEVMKQRSESYVVRITHDDILIDAQTILDLLEKCKRHDARYGITPTIVEGAGVEIIHRDNLLKAAEQRTEPTEYISYFVRFGKQIQMRPRPGIERAYRLTLDYPDDAVVLETVLRETGPLASLDNVVNFIDRYPSILKINKLPLLSLYTCAYNANAYIDRTLDSVFHHHQWNPIDYEYLVVDDGSIDSTLLRLSRFGGDPRLKIFVNETNQGLASSSNIALSKARGSYVMRIDADDLLLSNALSFLVDQIQSEQSSVVYPAYKEIDENEAIISPFVNPRDHHHAGCALMDKRMINEIRFTDGLKHWDSKDLYHRIKSKFKISYTQEPLWMYRKHKKSLSAQRSIERDEALKKIAHA